jgi:xanthine dehydrogenase YagS FAD-binding subunit
VSERCIALHASDVAVALVALDAIVSLDGPAGARRVPLVEFYLDAGTSPDVENVMHHGELITSVAIPLLPRNARSGYLKVRDRVSYEFALTSAAASVVLQAASITDARIGLGGVGSKPWRAWEAERVLCGRPATTASFRAAAEVALRDPWTVEGTAFKVELAKRTLVRILQTLTGVSP